ncbi:MAG: hypothetical protein RR865_00575 [Clostridia bacterium]
MKNTAERDKDWLGWKTALAENLSPAQRKKAIGEATKKRGPVLEKNQAIPELLIDWLVFLKIHAFACHKWEWRHISCGLRSCYISLRDHKCGAKRMRRAQTLFYYNT